jgi:SAM-dependent methyltransferase
MEHFRQAFGGLAGGRVLDVATGEGGFVGILAANLESYAEIIGVDLSAPFLTRARRGCDQRDVRFLQMDGERLAFADESFDTVSIAVSLHHLADVPRVLGEMRRVLKRGGHCAVTEMHRDAGTEPQLTAVRIHHWAAAVDTALGISHNETLARQEIVDHVQGLGLRDLACYGAVAAGSDPLDGALIAQVDGYIDRALGRAAGAPTFVALKAQGEALRRRLRQVGVQREPVVIILGQKPWSG